MPILKIRSVWLKNWASHAHLYFKIKMAVARLFLDATPYLEPFLAVLIFNYVLINIKEISNQVTGSLFSLFQKIGKKRFFYKKKIFQLGSVF